MALGGGTYITQNKVLPGVYMNFISKATASGSLTDRGVAAVPIELNWGVDGSMYEVTQEDFQKNSLKIFGYDYSADELKGLRDLFLRCKTLYVYNVFSGGAKATATLGETTLATAKYAGIRGNALKVVVAANADDSTAFDVSTYIDSTLVDAQKGIANAAALEDNDFVTWNDDAELSVSAGVTLSGGTNGSGGTTAYQAFIDAAESYNDINVVGYVGTTDAVKALFAAWADRLREDVGIKLQVVLHDYTGDSISVINVKNSADAVWWVVGAEASAEVSESLTNTAYDGEFEIPTNYTQKQLEAAIKAGEFVFHKVGDDVRVLDDINSFTSVTDTQGDVFKDNQTVRIIDNIATSVASIFVEKYLGKVPNDESGRVSLWSDIVYILQQLQDLRALEDFDSEDVVVSQGDTKKAVVVDCAITVVNAMTKLYMQTVVA